MDKKSRICSVLVGLLFIADVYAQEPIDLMEMQALIKAGEAQAAYTELQVHQYDRAGDPDFDYLLGLAALQSGHPDEATLAFERVLTVRPDMLGARLDMARAYFELGNYDLARQEFEELQKQNPPEEARKVMQQYLQSIKKAKSPSAWTAFVEASMGHNTNVNSAGGGSVFIPALGGTVTLDSSSVETADEFMQLRAVGQATHRMTPTLSAYGSFDLRARSHLSENSFNTKQGTVSGGLQKTVGKHTFKAGLSFSQFNLDGNGYRDIWAVNGEWAFSIDSQNTIGAFVQRNEIRYKDDDDISENSDLSLAGITWTRALDAKGDAIISASLFTGYDQELEGRIDGSRTITGARAAVQYRLDDAKTLYASAGVQKSRYREENTLFLEERDDEQFDMTLGMNWQYRDNWVFNPYISYIKNNSNIDIDEYDGTEAGLTVRRTIN